MIALVPDYYVPKRSPKGGLRISFWANTAVQAALEAEAATQGLSVHQVAARIIAAWAARDR